MKSLIIILYLALPIFIQAQSKYDYQWTIGYDTSLFDPGGDVILMNFNKSPVGVQTIKTVERFGATGANTTMSDANGKLIFYTSGCYIVNAAHEIMENGDSINTGIILKYYCPGGNSPNDGGAIAIPWPDSPNLYLLFVNDYESIKFPGETMVIRGAARRLYYNVIDMTRDMGLGAVVLKNQVLIHDTMSINSIEACRHSNGRDWWILIPKPRSNCYHIALVNPQGPQISRLVCTGIPWDKNDEVGQSFFTPDTKKFIRYNSWNGIHIYDFDNENGLLSNETVIPTPDITFNNVGAAISSNSRYLYVCALTRLFQYDLEAPDITASRILLTVNDDVPDPFVPTSFYHGALAPDGKIYISGGSSHLSLHVVHRPDCPGLYSLPERRGLKLTSLNYASIPNMPFFRNEPSETPCDSMVVHTYTPVDGNKMVVVFPNPAHSVVKLIINRPLPDNSIWLFYDALGRTVRTVELVNGLGDYTIDVSDVATGIYHYSVMSANRIIEQGKLILIGD